MLMDKKLTYHKQQDLTGDSTGAHNSVGVDHGIPAPHSVGKGSPMILMIQIDEAVQSGGAATVAFKLQDSEDGSTWADTEVSIPAQPVADLVPGWRRRIAFPETVRQHTRLVRTVGSFALTGGSLTASVMEG